MADLVNARWVAGWHAELPDKTELVPHETVVKLPRHEAEGSGHWEIVERSKPRAEKAGER